MTGKQVIHSVSTSLVSLPFPLRSFVTPFHRVANRKQSGVRWNE